uniref:Uncharacterized protein n=1 Tax=Megaselia scalaris TaxID=36166 RepID=T1GIC9_MEGSC
MALSSNKMTHLTISRDISLSIYVDNQALESVRISSEIMKTCKKSSKDLTTTILSSGYVEIESNEIADEQAMKGSTTPEGDILNVLGRSVNPQ